MDFVVDRHWSPYSLSLPWSCNGAIVWASGGSALKGLGSLSWSCGGDGFAVGVVGGGWS